MSFEMEGTTIPHEITVEWDGAKVLLKPAPEGTGVIAGSKVRSVSRTRRRERRRCKKFRFEQSLEPSASYN